MFLHPVYGNFKENVNDIQVKIHFLPYTKAGFH